MNVDLAAVTGFLPCESSADWVRWALTDIETLLIDHANCERKAASTAMHLLYRHVDKADLMLAMSRLAREELLHFRQVVELMRERGIGYARLGPSRYAEGLRKHIDHDGGRALTDTLIIGAFIEARSCERFGRLIPHLDPELARFYSSLLRSEARHFQDYLSLARQYSGADVETRIAYFGRLEKALIEAPDRELRFHSGTPVGSNLSVDQFAVSGLHRSQVSG